MSIDDSIYDISDHVQDSNVEDAFNDVVQYISTLEQTNGEIQARNFELENALKVLMGIKEEKNNE